VGNGYLNCCKLCANVLIIVILVAKHITTWYILRGVYDRELLYVAFLRQGKTVNVFSCDVCMVPFVEDNVILIVYLYTVSLISYNMMAIHSFQRHRTKRLRWCFKLQGGE
jgi:hypothetical protein